VNLESGGKVLHNLLFVPEDGIGVEISSWVKPKIDTLLPISSPTCIDVSLQRVRLP